MPKNRRPAAGLALSVVREALELEQTEVAEALEVTPGTVSDYERGKIAKTREETERLVARLGVSPWSLDVVFEGIAAVRRDGALESEALPIPLAKEARAALVRITAEAARGTLEILVERTLVAQAQADRQFARRTWEMFERGHPQWTSDAKRLRESIERLPDFATWAFADLLADRSLATAPELPKVALVLGELALRAAEGAAAGPVFLAHLQAKALATIGNARRVLGFLPDSERAFLEARKLWPVGAKSPGDILTEARLFDLEASLRRDQRRFAEAHALLDRAYSLTPEGSARGRHLLIRSSVFEQQGYPEGSIDALRKSLAEFGNDCPTHQRMGSLLLLAVNLDHLGRPSETLEVIPLARQLAIEVGSGPNLLRLLWLEARAWTALGKHKEAITPLEQVRREFVSRGNLLDVAFVSLELAAIYLEEGRTADTRRLALELSRVFATLGITPERLAAVWLFLESAVEEEATAELARQAAAALSTTFPNRAVLRG